MTLLPSGAKGFTIRVQELTFFHVFSHPGDLNMQIRFLQSDVFCFNIGVYHRQSLPRTKLRSAVALRGRSPTEPLKKKIFEIFFEILPVDF